MLAKEIKIQNLKRQREFIKAQLSKMLNSPREDGDPAYRYVGQVFPEVIDYFSKEGFKVELITSSDSLAAATKGMPVYLFTISESVILSEEELKRAEEVEYNPDDEEMSSIGDIMSSFLLGGGD